MIAQNLDLAQYPGRLSDPAADAVRQVEGEIMMLSVPGMISLNGMKSFGFAVCDNTLGQLRTSIRGDCQSSRSTGCSSKAAHWRRRAPDGATPHAVGLNWVMGDPDGGRMIERSGGASSRAARRRATRCFSHQSPADLHGLGRRHSPGAPHRPRPSRSILSAACRPASAAAGRAASDIGIEELKASSPRGRSDYPVSRGGGPIKLTCRSASRWPAASSSYSATIRSGIGVRPAASNRLPHLPFD